MNILWRLKICLKKKGWNDRLSNAQKLQTDNSATACAITDNQSRYSGIVACPFSVAPGSTATVVVVSCSRVRSKEGGRVRQGAEVSLDTNSSLKSRAEKRNVL